SIRSLNPFNNNTATNEPTTTTTSTSSSSDDDFFKLSYFERLSLFIITLLGSISCQTICFLLFPILSLKPKKFALIWTLGSILFLTSFAFLNGFKKFGYHLISENRVWFSLCYLSSIFITLFFCFWLRSSIAVIFGCVFQVLCQVWYTVSYFPLGRDGLRFVQGAGRDRVVSWVT
ncbi:hypothetical protein CANARDRAFT_180920, partial [[Candida] arabinofermentans NRRL YB-2248]